MLAVSLIRRAVSHSAAASAATAAAASSTSSTQTLQETVAAALLSSRYLRHAPPRLYITCAPNNSNSIDDSAYDALVSSENGETSSSTSSDCSRHRTTVLDVSRAASPAAPPHTQSIYLLTSTTMQDVTFSDTAVQSQVLVGLPQVRTVDAVHRFCDTHAASLTNVHHVVLPGDVDPAQSLLIKTLLERLPAARLACNAFGQALLTNPAFHDGLRRAVVENAPATPLDLLRFAELPPTRVSALQDGDALAVDVPKTDATSGEASKLAISPARKLRVVAVKNAAQEQRRKANSQTHHPPYFVNQPLFLYDDAFHSMFVGHTLHRLPWLPTIVKEATRELVLPMPPPLALQHPMGSRAHGVLLDSWRLDEAAAAVSEALRRRPAVERVLAASYGELSGNVEDCVAALEKTTATLEELRSRLAHRLSSDTSRDVHRWSTALLKRVVQEVVCVQKSSEPTSPAALAAFTAWAQEDGGWGRLATCLTQSAMVLPPTVAVTPPVSRATAEKKTDGVADAAHPLEGSSGVDLLVAIFEKKGLQGLTRTVQRENIDVQVFLAMSETDLKSVFKATFGITKRLSLLQEELRQNL